jgi:hypothetical protein
MTAVILLCLSNVSYINKCFENQIFRLDIVYWVRQLSKVALPLKTW